MTITELIDILSEHPGNNVVVLCNSDRYVEDCTTVYTGHGDTVIVSSEIVHDSR
jgi:hypothetical protein